MIESEDCQPGQENQIQSFFSFCHPIFSILQKPLSLYIIETTKAVSIHPGAGLLHLPVKERKPNDMKKHICILQTSFAKRDDTIAYLKEKLPDVKVSFITDDTLLADTRSAGAPTASVYARMSLYAQAAVLKGADLILNSCTSVGDVADEYAKTVAIPVVRIDEAMCREALSYGTRFAFLSTLPTSAPPIKRRLEALAAEQGKTVTADFYCEQEAWDALSSGNPQKHNELLINRLKELDQKNYDAILMAQISMRELLPVLGPTKTPVLCGFPSGLDYAVKILEEA